jgi:hypothetical protein
MSEQKEIDWQARYDKEHTRFCELSGLIDALGVIADDLGGTPIDDPYIAQRRNAVCGISRAMQAVSALDLAEG